jgi:hypothetical protein
MDMLLAPLQSGYVGAKVGDPVSGGEEGGPAYESCKAQGGWNSSDVASKVEAVFFFFLKL